MQKCNTFANHVDKRLQVGLEKARHMKPLIYGLALALFITICTQIFSLDFELYEILRNFMGAYFLIFGALKLINLNEYVKQVARYDHFSNGIRAFAYAYPYIELILAVFYFTDYNMLEAEVISAILTFVSLFAIRSYVRKNKRLRSGSKDGTKSKIASAPSAISIRTDEILCVCMGSKLGMPFSRGILLHYYVLMVIILSLFTITISGL